MALLLQRRYSAQTITQADHAYDIVLLANTPVQAESLLHSQKQTAGGIGLHVNAYKTGLMCFNQRCHISTVSSEYLKLMDKFTYLRSRVSSSGNKIIT